MLTAGVAAAGTGLSAAAFAQTKIHIPGSLTSDTGPLGDGNQIRTDVPVGARGNAINATGNQMTQCWGCAATGHGFGRDVLATRSVAEAWEGHAVAESTGSTIGGLGSGCVCLRGTDAVASLPPFQDSRHGMPARFGAYDSSAIGRSGGPPGLTRLVGRGDRRDNRLGQAVPPWQASQPPLHASQPWQASQVTEPWLVNQSGQVNQLGLGTESGPFIQTGQKSRTGQGDTSDATGLETQLARLPLAVRLPLAASTPSLAGLAGLGGAVALSRLVTAHGAGVLPLAALIALILLAGAFSAKLAGRRRRGVRGVQRGAMTS